jgi:hypothetical protein
MINQVSLKSAVLDWIQDNGLGHEEIDEPMLLRWAADGVAWCSTKEDLKHRIVILRVENSRARLPDDFELLCQAASNVEYKPPCDCSNEPKPDCCGKKSMPRNNRMVRTRKEDIVQWVQGSLEKDCELEINLKCPTCHNTSCECETPAIEVDVDRIWEMAHPELYYGHFTRIGRFGNGPGLNSPYASYYTDKFKLMNHTTNEFHRLNHFVTDCPNVNCDNCYKEFTLALPYIEVDFEEGEILLSYLGKHLDENGIIMIPDHPDVHEAIVNHLDYKWYRLQWKKTKDAADGRISQEAMALREMHIGYAKSELDMPSYLKFKEYLEKSSFMKRLPAWSSDYMGKKVPDRALRYGQMLDGNRDY